MKSQAHQNFDNLLHAIVSVPSETVKAKLAEERAERQAKGNGKTQERMRPIVSPDLVSSAKRAR
jgi:hypothetical protein